MMQQSGNLKQEEEVTTVEWPPLEEDKFDFTFGQGSLDDFPTTGSSSGSFTTDQDLERYASEMSFLQAQQNPYQMNQAFNNGFNDNGMSSTYNSNATYNIDDFFLTNEQFTQFENILRNTTDNIQYRPYIEPGTDMLGASTDNNNDFSNEFDTNYTPSTNNDPNTPYIDQQVDNSAITPFSESSNTVSPLVERDSLMEQLNTPKSPVKPQRNSNNSRQQRKTPGKTFHFDLKNYIYTKLDNFIVYASEKVTIGNLSRLDLLIKPLYNNSSRVIDPLDLPEIVDLSKFRNLNHFTIQDCYQAPTGLGDHETLTLTYLEDNDVVVQPGRFQYDPTIRRTYETYVDGNLVTICEGLCPYCPVIKFGQLKNSNYGHHLCIKHGIQTNGIGIPSPHGHGLYYYEKLNKMNWTNVVFEGVMCPVENCQNICKVSQVDVRDGTLQNRLLDYSRHYKKCHKTGRLLDLMRRNKSRV